MEAMPAETYEAQSVVNTTRGGHLAVVAQPDAEPQIGRAALRGAAVGFSAVAALVGLMGVLCGLEAGSAAGLAVFVASFGGIGFGAMLGASLAQMQEYR